MLQSKPVPSNQAKSAWQTAQQQVLAQLTPQLTGRDWLTLHNAGTQAIQLSSKSQTKSLELQPPTVHTGRITALPANCVDGILCQNSFQAYNKSDLLVKEIEHLLRPGGWLLVTGAGSLRGRMAADMPTGVLDLPAVAKLFSASHLQVSACYSHGSQPHNQQWRQRLAKVGLWLNQNVMKNATATHPAFIQWATTRPGWVLVLTDRRHNPSRPASSSKLAFKTSAGAATSS